MPYGISKSKGGDSDRNEKRMERCVRSVMSRQDVSKESAIRICKASLFGHKKGSDKYEGREEDGEDDDS